MKIHILGIFMSFILLSACTDADWQREMSFAGFGHSTDQTPAPTVETSAPQPAALQPQAPDAWCQAVARQDAMHNDFDIKTQQIILQRSYNQCVAIFGSPDAR